MDAIDILGGMLGHKSTGSGMGAEILKEILGGKPRPQQKTPTPPSRPTAPAGPADIHSEARELEEMLNVAHKRYTGRTTAPPPQMAPNYQSPSRPRADVRPEGAFPQQPSPRSGIDSPRVSRQNEQALVLIRAMLNAAKSDGRIEPAEEQKLLDKVGGGSREAIDFLRNEIAKPLDVRDFAWSVPLGMEQQVYTMSLAAIDLDANAEAKYLKELAHGLRIPPHVCDQIHQQFGVPCIFQNTGRQ